jgi:hypothetical protein
MAFKQQGPITLVDRERIFELIETSRTILKANGNRSWNIPIDLITDDIQRAYDRSQTTYRINPDGRKKTYYGFAWSTKQGAVLWFRNTWLRTRDEAVRTLCHEVTHALVNTSVHGQVWRRAYALLLPFWLEGLEAPRLSKVSMHNQLYEEMVRVAVKYRRRSNRNLIDVGAEVSDHIAASTRTWEKRKGLFIPTTV